MKKIKMRGDYKSGNKQSRVIVIMGCIILILTFIIIYSFALKPMFDEYVISKQVEAQDIILSNLLGQLQQNGYIQIPIGDEVLILVPYQEPESS